MSEEVVAEGEPSGEQAADESAAVDAAMGIGVDDEFTPADVELDGAYAGVGQDADAAAAVDTAEDPSPVMAEEEAPAGSLYDAITSESSADAVIAATEDSVADAPASYGMAESWSEPSNDSPARAAPDHEATYIVRVGDTLGEISLRVYGTSRLWRELADLNGISDPSRIMPGDEIRFDVGKGSARQYAERNGGQARLQVVVAAGETLSSIAARLYQTESAWRYLWRQNRDQVSDPNRIRVGQKLVYVAHSANTASSGQGTSKKSTH